MTASLYEVLEIQTDASQLEIRRAFRALALKHHPDKQLDAQSSDDDRFIPVRHAYEVLSNTSTRRQYDLELARATRRKEQGLPPETGRPRFDPGATTAEPIDLSVREVIAFGILAAFVLLVQHLLLCWFGRVATIVLNVLLCLAMLLLMPDQSETLALLIIIGSGGSLVAYFGLWLVSKKLLGIQVTAPIIACVVAVGATGFATLHDMPRQHAVVIISAILGMQAVILLLPWWAELLVVASACSYLSKNNLLEQGGDVLLLYIVLTLLHQPYGIFNFIYWIFSTVFRSVFRVVSWLGSLYVVYAALRWAYIKADRPMWVRQIIWAIDDLAYVLCQKLLPDSIMREAAAFNAGVREGRTDAKQQKSGSQRKKKKRKAKPL